MGQLMRQLSQDQRQQVAQLLQSLPQDLRPVAKQQILQIDYASLSADQLYQQMVSVINAVASQVTGSSQEGSSISVYA